LPPSAGTLPPNAMFVGAVASRLIETPSGPDEPPALVAEHE
jgi:hypothetical protein